MTVDPHSDTAEFPRSAAAEAADWPRRLPSRVKVEVAALSDKGRVRATNEDHYLVARTSRRLDVLATNLPPGEVPGCAEETGHGLVVADGMGGEKGGEVASRLAIRTFVELTLEVPDWIMRFSEDIADEAVRRVRQRYRDVDAALTRQAQERPGLARMGTTMTLAYNLGADLFVAHVGDSRAYLFRQGDLRQLTRDQTLAQKLLDLGEITREEATAHHLRHVLTNVLGRNWGDITVDVQRHEIADGDSLLVCSDGLTEMVPETQIVELLRQAATSSDACRSLVDLALARGGKDNVTVIVARYRFQASPNSDSAGA